MIVDVKCEVMVMGKEGRKRKGLELGKKIGYYKKRVRQSVEDATLVSGDHVLDVDECILSRKRST